MIIKGSKDHDLYVERAGKRFIYVFSSFFTDGVYVLFPELSAFVITVEITCGCLVPVNFGIQQWPCASGFVFYFLYSNFLRASLGQLRRPFGPGIQMTPCIQASTHLYQFRNSNLGPTSQILATLPVRGCGAMETHFLAKKMLC